MGLIHVVLNPQPLDGILSLIFIKWAKKRWCCSGVHDCGDTSNECKIKSATLAIGYISAIALGMIIGIIILLYFNKKKQNIEKE